MIGANAATVMTSSSDHSDDGLIFQSLRYTPAWPSSLQPVFTRICCRHGTADL